MLNEWKRKPPSVAMSFPLGRWPCLGQIYWLLPMAESGIPEKFLPAIRAVFWTLPPIFLLVGIERIFDGKWNRYAVAGCLGAAFLSLAIAVYWDRLIPRFRKKSSQSLKYLTYRDSTLGEAIISMAQQSAWGRWFAAQHLVNNGTPIGQRYLLHTAASIVMDQILDGNLAVRGRRPGGLEYEDIARTDWRSSTFYFSEDPISLWRLHICPRGVVQIEPDGTVHASDAIAAQRTAQLDYDSFIVDGYQFEKLWPKTDSVADKKRRKLLREAQRRRLDKDEIQRLSCGVPRWPGLLARFLRRF
jgi:hypothetical protein